MFKNEAIQKKFEAKVTSLTNFYKEEYGVNALNGLQITEMVNEIKQEIIKQR